MARLDVWLPRSEEAAG